MRAGYATLSSIILVTAVSGCATSNPPPAPAAPAVSFDGTFQGTIRLTSSGVSGVESRWCDTPPAISLSIKNNAFSYVLMHPNVPRDSHYSLSPAFAVSVTPDGSFDATSPNGEAEMIGSITGSHLQGRINGTACGYAFTAEKS